MIGQAQTSSVEFFQQRDSLGSKYLDRDMPAKHQANDPLQVERNRHRQRIFISNRGLLAFQPVDQISHANSPYPSLATKTRFASRSCVMLATLIGR